MSTPIANAELMSLFRISRACLWHTNASVESYMTAWAGSKNGQQSRIPASLSKSLASKPLA